MHVPIETKSSGQCVTHQAKKERFLPRETVLEMAVERASILEAENSGRDTADSLAIQWALDQQGVPLRVVGGELVIDEAAWQAATDYVSRHADQIVAAKVHLPTAVRLTVIATAQREASHG